MPLFCSQRATAHSSATCTQTHTCNATGLTIFFFFSPIFFIFSFLYFSCYLIFFCFKGQWILRVADDFPYDEGYVVSYQFTFRVFKTYTPSPSPTPVSAPSPTPHPSPSPHTRPTPIPVPSPPKFCCQYISSSDLSVQSCISLTFGCPVTHGWFLSLQEEMSEELCWQQCHHDVQDVTPIPSPSPVPTRLPQHVEYRCCLYVAEEMKKCLRLVVESCPMLDGWSLLSDFVANGLTVCEEFCTQ